MIEYSNSIVGLTSEALDGGFFAGWPSRPSAATHLMLLRGGDHIVLARDGAAVVGFINALSDGCYMAYIPLLEVLSTHRGRGIGTELVRRLLNTLEAHYHIALLCDSEVQPFYERLGLIRNPGMVRVNMEQQRGTPR
jgi:GNAT superfamily N-acetyltransferase